MKLQEDTTSLSERELTVNRVIDATPETVYQCWTEEKLIVQWFTPPPFKTIRASMDLRAGGSTMVVMQAPDGTEIPNPGVFLEVIPNEKIVFTNAYVKAWEPSNHAFMTAILTFEDLGNGKTNYTARVLHWTREDREEHERMGFHSGWGTATNQLAALAATL